MKAQDDGETIDLGQRMVRAETQIKRIVSDIESEKRTRARVNEDMEQRLREIERSNWKSSGAVMVVVVVVNLLAPILLKLLHL